MMSGNAEDEPQSATWAASTFRFFANPWVGIFGSIASIVGLILAVYFYLVSVRYPELVYYESPVRAVVVNHETASRLAVSYDNRPITEDVTAVQLAIWNRGNEPIRRAAILQPLLIHTEGGAPILEVSLRKISREVVRLELDQTKIETGELRVTWNVLESGDGGILQIVYAGGPEVMIHCSAVIESQPTIRELKYSGTIRSPSEQMRALHKSRSGNVVTLYGAILVVFLGVLRFYCALSAHLVSHIWKFLGGLNCVIGRRRSWGCRGVGGCGGAGALVPS